MSDSAASRPWAIGQTAFEAPLDARLAFVRRTFVHVGVAALGFVAVSYMLYAAGLGETMIRVMFGGGWIGRILYMLGFVALASVGRWMARSSRSVALQYGGLALVVALYGVLLAPLIFFANSVAPGVLMPAAGLTVVAFAGLAGFVVVTRKDLTFMGPLLAIAGLVLVGVLLISMFFSDLNLGASLWLTGAFIVFACGAILYDTSNVIHVYRTDEHVGAALELFCSMALLFQQILTLLIQLSGRSRD